MSLDPVCRDGSRPRRGLRAGADSRLVAAARLCSMEAQRRESCAIPEAGLALITEETSTTTTLARFAGVSLGSAPPIDLLGMNRQWNLASLRSSGMLIRHAGFDARA